MISPGTDASGSSLPSTATSISRACGTAASTTILRSKVAASVIAVRSSATCFAFEMPTPDPRFPGFARTTVRLKPDATSSRHVELFDHVRGLLDLRRTVGQRPPAVLFDLDRNGLVALGVEVLEHGRRRGERHFVLTRSAAVDHADPH